MDEAAGIMLRLAESEKARGAADINEAATRLEFVNQILVGVLGWQTEEFHPEEFAGDETKRKWIDYHLRRDEATQIIVEAKRIGKTFEVPKSTKHRVLKLSTLVNNCGDELREALDQARDYCQRTGTVAFAVSNGTQWVAGYSAWPNVHPDTLQAVVFYGIDDIRANLAEFIGYLSPEGISQQLLLTQVLARQNRRPVFASSVNQALPDTGRPTTKNYLSSEIEVLMKACFDELTDKKYTEMLRSCYVTDDLSEGDVKRLSLFVGKALPHYVDATYLNRVEQPLETQFAQGTALLVVGPAGSGKSTFLQHAIDEIRRGSDPSSHVILRLDLRDQTQLAATRFDHDKLLTDLSTKLLEQAEVEYPPLSPFAYDNLRGIFYTEIQRETFARAPAQRSDTEAIAAHVTSTERGNPSTHLTKYLKYLSKSHGLRVTVVLDNVDRGSEEFERVVFGIAKEITARSGATTISSLRDSTYFRGKKENHFDVGIDSVFAISPPSFRQVVAKRLQYIRDHISESNDIAESIFGRRPRFPLGRIIDFAEILSDILLRVEGRDRIETAIQDISGSNVREALSLLRRFSTSAHTDIEELFRMWEAQTYARDRNLFDSFLKSVLLGQRHRYQASESPIANIFEVSSGRRESHFTRYRILRYMDQLATGSGAADTPVDQVVAAVATAYRTRSEVQDGINALGQSGLVTSRTRPEPPWELTDLVRITSSGRYHLRHLVLNREYLKRIIDDTIIYDDKMLETLVWCQRMDKPWEQRHEEKLVAFLSYLLQMAKTERPFNPNSTADVDSEFVMNVANHVLSGERVRDLASPAVATSARTGYRRGTRGGSRK